MRDDVWCRPIGALAAARVAVVGCRSVRRPGTRRWQPRSGRGRQPSAPLRAMHFVHFRLMRSARYRETPAPTIAPMSSTATIQDDASVLGWNSAA